MTAETREIAATIGIVAAAAAAGGLAGWLLVHVLRATLSRAPGERHTAAAALDALRRHVPLWTALAGIVIAAHALEGARATLPWLRPAVRSLFILSLSWVAARFLVAVVEGRLRRHPETFPATTLTLNVVRVVVLGLGALMVVSNLGIQITPVLTALGVGSLAVALALQPTLSNVFAGFNITAAGRIRVGDFVELEDGQQGYVTDIGWRSTQIRELSNNMILVPNSRLAELVVRNTSLPEPEQAALVNLGVAYGSDLDVVESVTIEVARGVQQEVSGAVKTFEPFIRYQRFAESSIDFTVILRVASNPDRHLVVHEFVKRLHHRYREASIEIPFPQRVVHIAGDHGAPHARPAD